jgi:hypothetical protein
LTPASAKPAKRSASAEFGLASRVISTLRTVFQCRLTLSISAAAVSGGISDGVPPPKKIETTSCCGASLTWRSRSAISALVHPRASTRSRTWELKSQ